MRAEEALGFLLNSRQISLSELPELFGIYALRNHAGLVRYIGSTPKLTEGFRTRIFSKHATGSEGRSHKFSQAYCTGRMWRFCSRIHPAAAASLQNSNDAAAAKRLRNAFIRNYCSASILEIPRGNLNSGEFAKHLVSLERQVQQLASSSMRAWEGIDFAPESEPSALVDELLEMHSTDREAIQRQQRIHASLQGL